MDSDESKKSIAKLAGVKRLAPFADLSIIDNFAKAYGLHPDEVYTKTPFDTIIQMAWMWREQAEYHERKAEIEKMMSEPQTSNK